ncbi:rhamnogalacturonan lyase [Nibricoccus aquaticus]|uniref:rhamnogalacturonan lyase family protein n=1 Tax=Nibricoccus aquaticus TaxID=2576891 RepID=UPI00158635D8|nr:rhamnogalacturonan lyase [Nibricoccus aquaticus]
MNTPRTTLLALAAFGLSLGSAAPLAAAPYQMENLGRGVVALRTSGTDVYIGWRHLGLDPSGIGYNVYRSANGATAVKLNASPITASTNFVDTTSTASATNVYTVRPVISGVEQTASAGFTLPANSTATGYLRVPLMQPAGGTTPSGEAYTYSPNDTSVGDLDGDGEYELVVKWDPSNSKDNSQSGYTGNVYLDAYRLNGTRLWRIDLGRNIRAGAHYTQFQVYDLDGDGRAEVACKTAPGTVSGTGQNVLMGSDSASADYRNSSGYILSGPEYLTIFNGQTGAALATAAYVVPRGTVGNWGDTYGNRVDRFLSGVAYLDGNRPSLIMCRGYYTRAAIAAWDYRNGALTQRWTFDTGDSTTGSLAAYRGQGAHSLSIADVDNDGKQEIIYGSCTIDDNGAGKYSTTLGHGDALHVSDMNPSRSGLEVWMVHESPSSYGNYGSEMHDASTGAILFGTSGEGADIGRGCAGDIDSRYLGYECWASRGGLYSASGTLISSTRPSPMNFMIWWDADLKREFLDGTTISKWNETAFNSTTLLAASGVASNNSTKSTPNLSGDILGDWREELILRETGNTALRIYISTSVATNRLYTLMHDAQYRVAIAWQNVGYNQPPHPGFYLGSGMSAQPAANITYVGGTVTPPTSDTYQAESAAIAGGTTIDSNNAGFNGTGFANLPVTGGSLTFSNVDGNGGGTKALQIRYALGAAAARTGNLTVNGSTTSITFQPTGAWTTWTTLTVNIALNNNSTNTIQFASTGGDLGNIDQITVP